MRSNEEWCKEYLTPEQIERVKKASNDSGFKLSDYWVAIYNNFEERDPGPMSKGVEWCDNVYVNPRLCDAIVNETISEFIEPGEEDVS